METLKLPLMVCAGLLACAGLTACAPLPPGHHYEPAPMVRQSYAREVVVVERPELHRVYPLLRDKRAPKGREYYDDHYGNRYAVDPAPERRRWR